MGVNGPLIGSQWSADWKLLGHYLEGLEGKPSA